MSCKVILRGEPLIVEDGVTDVIAPPCMRVDCWQQAVKMIGPGVHFPKVRFWIAATLDTVTTMTQEERAAFVLGWFGREAHGGGDIFDRRSC